MKNTTWFLAVATACLLLCQATAEADYASAVLADDPIGYWRFNDGGSDIAANAGTLAGDLDGDYLGGQLVPNESFQLADGRTVSLVLATPPLRSETTSTNTCRSSTRS